MEMKICKFEVSSDLYKSEYVIRGFDVKDCEMKARTKFSKRFCVFGNKVKVKLLEE